MKKLYANGSPWYFESCARTLSILLNTTKKPVTVKRENSYTFPIDHNQYGITKTKWLKGTVSLFEKNNIKVDYEKLGVLNQYNNLGEMRATNTTRKRNAIEKCLWLLKRNFKFVKRSLHIGYSFYKHCRYIDSKRK